MEIPEWNGVPGFSRELGERTRVMQWNLTINSNVPEAGGYEGEVNSVRWDLKDAVDTFFRELSRDDTLLDIFRVTFPGTSDPTGIPFSRALLQSLQWTGGEVERGYRRGELIRTGARTGQRSEGYGNRIHLHGVLRVYHWSNIRLDARKLQAYLNFMLTFSKNQDLRTSLPTDHRNPNIKGVSVFFRSASAKDDPFNKFQYDFKGRYERWELGEPEEERWGVPL